jgi:hypothetical protein
MTADSRVGLVPGLKAAAFLIGLLALFMIGCRRGIPVIDTSSGPAQADGTISGTVRGPAGTSSIEGRVVHVIDVDTGARQQTTTNSAGGYTVKVKPGKYRVQVELRGGESILKQPGVMDVDRSDVDAYADFVIGQKRVSRPRLPVHQGDAGLGPPIA